MCDLVGQPHDIYYENLKNILFNRLEQNKEQLDTLEE
jgi:hypothetical protein